VPPVAVSVMVAGAESTQKEGVSTEAPLGEVGASLTVTVTESHAADTQLVVVLRARAK
jgi:hypothetical protein